MRKPQIFLIHGLFMHGHIMKYMQTKLTQSGYDVHCFSYKTVSRPLRDNAALLIEFVRANRQTGDVCHFVGHSLGGLLIRLAYELSPELFTGRIVTVGTPHNGSVIAERVAKDLHDKILGGSFPKALDGNLPAWQGEIELGSIAGDKSIGLGFAFTALEQPNDGTVAVSETQLHNQTAHLVLPLSHTALIYSKRVCVQIDCFLRTGQFEVF